MPSGIERGEDLRRGTGSPIARKANERAKGQDVSAQRVRRGKKLGPTVLRSRCSESTSVYVCTARSGET